MTIFGEAAYRPDRRGLASLLQKGVPHLLLLEQITFISATLTLIIVVPKARPQEGVVNWCDHQNGVWYLIVTTHTLIVKPWKCLCNVHRELM